MSDSTNHRLAIVLAAISAIFSAVQAFGSALGSLVIFGDKPELFRKFVTWTMIPTIAIAWAFLAYTRRLGAISDSPATNLTGSNNTATTDQQTQSPPQSQSIHRMVVFTLWSILASCVVVPFTNHSMAFYLITLSPLWIGVGGFLATRIAAGHRVSAILLAGLFCGSFGAWLGSIGGNTGMQLGFTWGCLTGGLAAGYFFDMDSYMSLWAAILGTLVFVGSVASALLPHDYYLTVRTLGNFARAGLPFLLPEFMLLLAGYSSKIFIDLLKSDYQKSRRRATTTNQKGRHHK